MQSEKGLNGAAREAAAAAGDALPAPEPDQLDLGLPPIRCKDGTEVVPQPRRPGRPAGASNKLSAEWRRFLLARYPSTLEGLVAIGSLGVEELAQSLKCTALEAMKIKVDCLQYATNFLYPRLMATAFKNAGDPSDPLAQSATLILAGQFSSDVLEHEPEEPPKS